VLPDTAAAGFGGVAEHASEERQTAWQMDEQFNISREAGTGSASQHPQDPIPHAVDGQVVLEIDPITIYERIVACGRENVEFPNRTVFGVRTGWNDKDSAVRLRGARPTGRRHRAALAIPLGNS
jgi:hypothetical protein